MAPRIGACPVLHRSVQKEKLQNMYFLMFFGDLTQRSAIFSNEPPLTSARSRQEDIMLKNREDDNTKYW